MCSTNDSCFGESAISAFLSHVTHMNESCLTYEWVMSQICMSHVTYMNASCHTYEWVLSHIWMRRVSHMNECHKSMSLITDMNESCHTYEWVMSYVWMSHVTYTNESCHTYDWVMSHVQLSHATRMDESCHTYERGMSHVWISLVTYMNESCHAYGWVMSHTWMSHVTPMNESYLTCGAQNCDTIAISRYVYVWHVSFTCVTRLIYVCDMTNSYVWHDSFMCATCLIHIIFLQITNHKVYSSVRHTSIQWFQSTNVFVPVISEFVDPHSYTILTAAIDPIMGHIPQPECDLCILGRHIKTRKNIFQK